MQRLRRAINNFIYGFQYSYRHLFVMYMLVLILPLTVTLALNELSADVLEKEIYASASTIANQARSTIDSRIEDVSMLIDQLNNHSTLRFLLTSKKPLSTTNRYMITTLINDLRKQFSYTSIVKTLFVYMSGIDSIISPQMRCSPEFFYGNYYYVEGLDFAQWKSEYLAPHERMRILPAQRVFDGTHTSYQITALVTLPRGDTFRPLGTLVLLIDERWLMSQGASASSGLGSSDLRVVSRDGSVMFSSDDADRAPIDVDAFSPDGHHLEQHDGSTYLITYVYSLQTDWYYVLRMPVNELFDNANKLRRTVLIALSIVILVGLGLVIILSYLSFLPFNSVMERAHNPGIKERRISKISLTDLGNLLDQARNDRTAFTEQLPSLIENYVFKLIYGHRDVQGDLSLLSEVLGFRFPSNLFAVLCLKIPEGTDPQVLHASVRSALAKMHNKDAGSSLYSTLSMDGTIAILISLWAGQSQDYGDLLRHHSETVLALLDAPLTLGVSMVDEGYAGIEKGYRQSLMCIAGAEGGPGCVYYADIACVVPSISYRYPLETEKILMACVCSGDEQRMRDILKDIFEKASSQISINTVTCLKYDMLGTLYKCMYELGGETHAENEDELAAIIRSLMQTTDFTDIHADFQRAFGRLCERAYRENRNHNDLLADKIIAYIKANYQNPDMGLDMVARAFSIAPGYLSRFFKAQTGGNFVDYITRLRIETAAHLMRTTGLSHSEVAKKCGLSGAQALNRLFNRVLSVSPSVYKQMAQEGMLNNAGFDPNSSQNT